jgi:hypothetical protein
MRAEPSLRAEVPEDAEARPADPRQHLAHIRIPKAEGEPSIMDGNVELAAAMQKGSPL